MAIHARALLTAVSTATFVVMLALESGCVIASPTYVTSNESPAAGDAGAATTSSSATTQSSTGTGATCAGGKFVKADVTKLTACGNGLGHCFDKAKVPGAEMFAACPNASEVCVPDEMLSAGGEKLKSCTSIIGPGGCVTTSLIPKVKEMGGDALKQDSCTASQRCVPCVDPMHGNAPTPFCQPIGVYEQPCAAAASAAATPTGPETPPATCCNKNGYAAGICLPATGIPEGDRDQAPQDTCNADSKCVPADFTQNKSRICNAGGGSRGVCMSSCFNAMMGIAGAFGLLSQDWCYAGELCIPCSQLAGKGVPGCG